MNNKTIPVITLDGPSGTGKGTLCFMLAKELQWNMLDSGAIYRVLAHAALKNAINPRDIEKLTHLAYGLDLRFERSENGFRTLLDNEEVSTEIRSEQCGQIASQIAAIPEIRQALLQRQRDFAQAPGLVTDGRDMGTIVFPDAFLKIFLYASAEERANRRYLQLQEKGISVSLTQVVEELTQRDMRDMARASSPLKPAHDAVQIDTTRLSIVQTFHYVLKLIEERLHNV